MRDRGLQQSVDVTVVDRRGVGDHELVAFEARGGASVLGERVGRGQQRASLIEQGPARRVRLICRPARTSNSAPMSFSSWRTALERACWLRCKARPPA